MEFGLQFSSDKVNVDALHRASAKCQHLTERRIVEIKEIADSAAELLLSDVADEVDLPSLLSVAFEGGVLPSPTPNPDTAEKCADAVLRREETANLYDKAEFAELIISALAERGVTLAESMFLPEDERPEVFAYVRNPFADEAYDVFSSDFSDSRVVYAKSFKEALALVESGEAGYCLLPLEERGSRLATIGELIFRGDFKINSVTPVFGFDGLADMKYALVSKSFTTQRIDRDDDRYLEIRIRAGEDADLSDVLLVARRYGITVYRINSSVYDTEGESELYYSVVFRDDGGDFTRLLTYLTVFCKAYTPVGIYKNLE